MNRLSMAVAGSVLCLAIGACGGSSPSGPSATSTPVPTPTPVSFSGTYSGNMAGTGNGVAAATCTGRTTVTQSGTTLTFSDLTVTTCVPSPLSVPGSTATLSGLNFTGNTSYNSAGCGVVASAWTGLFSGDARLLNLRVVLTPGPTASSDCGGVLQFLGEIVRN